MPNALYDNFRNLLIGGGTGTLPDLSGSSIKFVLLDNADHTSQLSTDVYLSDVSVGIVDTSGVLATDVGIIGPGVFHHQDVTLLEVTGDQAEEIIYFNDTTNPATSLLICLFDDFPGGSGMPVTPTGNDIDVQPAQAGVFVI